MWSMFMWTKKELILFLAGAEAFHTLSHIFIAYLKILPIKFLSIKWTQQLNLFAIIANALITLGLIYWAHTL